MEILIQLKKNFGIITFIRIWKIVEMLKCATILKAKIDSKLIKLYGKAQKVIIYNYLIVFFMSKERYH